MMVQSTAQIYFDFTSSPGAMIAPPMLDDAPFTDRICRNKHSKQILLPSSFSASVI